MKEKKPVRFFILLVATLAMGIIIGILIKLPQTKPHPLQMQTVSDERVPITALELKRTGYTLVYDGRCRAPLYVQENLTRESATNKNEVEGFSYYRDEDIPSLFRATPKDYDESGFELVQMAPAEDFKYSKHAIEESFLLSNVCPQCPQLKGYWKKLDMYVRAQLRSCQELKVFSGPLYLPKTDGDGKRYVTYQVIGKNDVAVPTHFFKVLIGRQGERTDRQAFIIPNEAIPQKTPLDKFKVSVDKVEKASGIIFSSLP